MPASSCRTFASPSPKQPQRLGRLWPNCPPIDDAVQAVYSLETQRLEGRAMSGERGVRETLRRKERRVQVKGIRQLPFARIENRYPPIQLLSDDEVESIHRASLRL